MCSRHSCCQGGSRPQTLWWRSDPRRNNLRDRHRHTHSAGQGQSHTLIMCAFVYLWYDCCCSNENNSIGFKWNVLVPPDGLKAFSDAFFIFWQILIKSKSNLANLRVWPPSGTVWWPACRSFAPGHRWSQFSTDDQMSLSLPHCRQEDALHWPQACHLETRGKGENSQFFKTPMSAWDQHNRYTPASQKAILDLKFTLINYM